MGKKSEQGRKHKTKFVKQYREPGKVASLS